MEKNQQREKVNFDEHNLLKKINESNKNSPKLLVYISLVKILCVFLVILKHTNANYWSYNEYWVSTNIMASFCMCAVPLFSLCIGATLLDFNERYDIKQYWKRRFKKIIVPIIGWNVVCYFYRVYILKNFKIVKFNFYELYNLYFRNKLYPIIDSLRIFMIGYMIIPLIAYIEKRNKFKIYLYCLIMLLINQSIIPYLLSFFHSNTLFWPYNYNFGYIIYLFAGYIIHNYKISKNLKILIYIFGIIGLLLRLTISHYLTLKYKKPDHTQINYVNFPIVMYSCSVFLFIKENCVFIFKILNFNIINKLGSLSMGPFFLHWLIIWSIKCNKLSFQFRFFGSFIITFLCFIITYIIKKIPLIKYLAP